MLSMIYLHHYYNRICHYAKIGLKGIYCCKWEQNFYGDCRSAMFYLKTLCIGNQRNLGICILDVLLLDRDYI